MSAFQSVAHLFQHRVSSTPDLEAFSFRAGSSWRSVSWSDVNIRVRAMAAGLRSLGVQDEEPVGIVCGTRVEWLYVDIGINVAGAATTTIYPSSTADDCAYIVGASGCRLVFAEDDAQVEKLHAVQSQISSVLHVINIDGAGSDDGWVIALADLEARGNAWLEEAPEGLDEVQSRPTPQHLATLIYTSRTTGPPQRSRVVA